MLQAGLWECSGFWQFRQKKKCSGEKRSSYICIKMVVNINYIRCSYIIH